MYFFLSFLLHSFEFNLFGFTNPYEIGNRTGTLEEHEGFLQFSSFR